MSPSVRSVESVVIPDLIAMEPFEFRINPLDSIIGPATDKWLETPGVLTTKKMQKTQKVLNAGLLGAMCWPDINDRERLQVCTDFVNFLFHLDDLTDDMDGKSAETVREAVIDPMDNPEKWMKKIERGEAHGISALALDLWLRICHTATPVVSKRFRDTFDTFFVAVTEEAVDRKKKVIRGVQDYIDRRRVNGAVRSCFALIEYANDFELPEEVFDHPTIRKLEDWANDLITWANDILSFPIEYERGDSSNIAMSVMHEKGLGVQDAMDHSSKLFGDVVENYVTARATLPSWGPEIDKMVELYLHGMEYWVIGSTEWCFWTQRYFEDGLAVREKRVIEFQRPEKAT
ncbi:terpenoid synthase [Dacryopinax primogenitus]|uniref:Terpene synthase n=1 Tax=Dacryopinax primogenitus (strain DJM 731) TaxID=1858805 RepID=M5FTX1_DACPD|nr:terpenoid synthase [Dacryopinax primogenitus]EJT99588.1 terpenoid synthase [Dacryopinax primogenitus]